MPAIAAIVSAALGILTPYLTKAGIEFAGEAGKAAWEQAEKVWKVLKGTVDQDPQLKPAMQLLATDKNNETFKAVFSQALEAKLKEQPELLERVVAALGGPERVQEVVAKQGGEIEDVSQTMSTKGQQTVLADGGKIKGVKQSM